MLSSLKEKIIKSKIAEKKSDRNKQIELDDFSFSNIYEYNDHDTQGKPDQAATFRVYFFLAHCIPVLPLPAGQ